MSLRKDKHEKLSRDGFRRILGRIHINENERSADTGVAPPFLLLKDGCSALPVATVIAAILASPHITDDRLIGQIGAPGLRPDDVMMVRTYIHRFGDDVTKPRELPEEGKILLLDENIPVEAVLPLSREFGWSTHVQTEGLAGRGTPDMDIWEYAARNQFAAIVTGDTDFLHMQKAMQDRGRNEGPSLLFVHKEITHGALCSIFTAHSEHILSAIYAGQPLCEVNRYGLKDAVPV